MAGHHFVGFVGSIGKVWAVTLRSLTAATALYGAGAVLLRPWMRAWGSTARERAVALPGDELVSDANQQTHAVTVSGAAAAVWPWLVQIGQGRAGFYSHDRLERLVGARITNAEEIHPEWQQLAVGDLVRTYRPWPRFEPLGWFVAEIDPERTLVLLEPARRGEINSSWSLTLGEKGGETRVLSRWRFRRRRGRLLFAALVFDPMHFVMETGMLRGLKRRAERAARGPAATKAMATSAPDEIRQ